MKKNREELLVLTTQYDAMVSAFAEAKAIENLADRFEKMEELHAQAIALPDMRVNENKNALSMLALVLGGFGSGVLVAVFAAALPVVAVVAGGASAVGLLGKGLWDVSDMDRYTDVPRLFKPYAANRDKLIDDIDAEEQFLIGNYSDEIVESRYPRKIVSRNLEYAAVFSEASRRLKKNAIAKTDNKKLPPSSKEFKV